MINPPNDRGFTEGFGQFAALQKLWLNSFSRMAQATLSFSPHSAPPEMLREVRDAMLKSMAQEWESFMRSPQFLEGMRQLLEGAMQTRQTVGKLATRVRHDLQGPALEDVDGMMLAARHMETRILERLDDLQAQLADMNRRLHALQNASSPQTPAHQRAGLRRQSKRATASNSSGAGKQHH